MPSAKREAKRDIKSAKKEVNLLNKKHEAQAIKNEAEALRSGRPVPYGDQTGATWRKSTQDQPVSIKTTTSEQDAVLQNLYKTLPQGIQNLNMPGSQSSFEPIANEARRNFSQKTIPGLAERFAGLGDSRLNSSGFQQSLAGATGDFESQLAAGQAQHGLQEQALQSNNLFNSLGSFLHPQFDYTVAPGQNSGIRNVWNSLKSPLLNAAGGYLTGGSGSAFGGLKNLFSGQSQQQQQPQYNGSGVGQNSFGFGGVNTSSFQPVQNQLTTKSLASSGHQFQLDDASNLFNY